MNPPPQNWTIGEWMFMMERECGRAKQAMACSLISGILGGIVALFLASINLNAAALCCLLPWVVCTSAMIRSSRWTIIYMRGFDLAWESPNGHY